MFKTFVIKGSKPVDPVAMSAITKVTKRLRRAKDKVATLQRDEAQLKKQFERELQVEAELDDWESFCHNSL